MGVVTVILLVAIAIGLLWAAQKGRINQQSLALLSSIAGIVAAIAAIVLFIIPAASPPSDKPASSTAIASAPTNTSVPSISVPTAPPTEAPIATDIPPTATPTETAKPPTPTHTPELPSPTPEPPTPTNTSTPTSPPIPLELTEGPWTREVKGVKLTVEKVEVIRRVEGEKVLRFHLTVDNQTSGGITIGLWNNFLAIDVNGKSYKPNVDSSEWEQNVPPGLTLTGFVDLQEPVPGEITTMTISFNYVFNHIGSIIVKDISIP